MCVMSCICVLQKRQTNTNKLKQLAHTPQPDIITVQETPLITTSKTSNTPTFTLICAKRVGTLALNTLINTYTDDNRGTLVSNSKNSKHWIKTSSSLALYNNTT